MLAKYTFIRYHKTNLIKFYEGETLLKTFKFNGPYKLYLHDNNIKLSNYTIKNIKAFKGITIIKYIEKR